MVLNSGVKVNKLCDSVRSLIIGHDSVDVHVFGSQMYGLATENSDVDIYLDIGTRTIKLKTICSVF